MSRRLSLFWGTHSLLADNIHSYEEMVEQATLHVLEEGFAKQHDMIVVVAGIPFAQAGTTNNLRVINIGRHDDAMQALAAGTL